MMNSDRRSNGNYEVAAVRKALEILCEFSAETTSLSVSEISRRLELPKSTTHNLLRTLEMYDFVKQDKVGRRYHLGARLYELGLRFSHSTLLVSAARPHLGRLAEQTKETVKLGILSGGEVLVLSALESPYQLHTRGDEGVRAPLHCTGLGKAILARLPAADAEAVMAGRDLPKFTQHTITTVERLKEELGRGRAQGFTVDMEENELGVVCVAAAFADAAAGKMGALSVSAPTSRLAGEQITDCARRVLAAARAVERELNRNSNLRRKT